MDELVLIYREHDTAEYVTEVFEVIAELLVERGAEVPVIESEQDEAQAPASAPGIDSNGGFLSFRKMVSVELIRGLYILGAMGVTAFGVTVILGGQFFGGLLVILVGNILWRLICEAGILLFSIHETLISIDRKVG